MTSWLSFPVSRQTAHVDDSTEVVGAKPAAGSQIRAGSDEVMEP